jgi:hypothetical protein
MTDPSQSADRTIHVKDAADGGEPEAEEGLATDEGPAQADAEDPTMGGSSDGDTAP